MNDRVFLAHFIDNKNNHVITGLVDAAMKVRALSPIPQVQSTIVQDVKGRILHDLVHSSPLLSANFLIIYLTFSNDSCMLVAYPP